MVKVKAEIDTCSAAARRRGLTLIEVLLAVAILGMGIVMMLTAISRCLRVLQASAEYHDVLWALSAGEVEFPMIQTERDEDMEPDDFEVSAEDFDGFRYERLVEDPYESAEDSEVRLIVIKTRISWMGRSKEKAEEITRYWLYRE